MPDKPTEETRDPLELLQSQIAEQAAQLQAAQNELARMRTEAAFSAAFAEAGGAPEHRADVLELIQMRVENLRDDKDRGLIGDYGMELKAATPAEIVEHFVESRPHYMQANASPTPPPAKPEPQAATPISEMRDQELWQDAGAWPSEPAPQAQPKPAQNLAGLSTEDLWDQAGDVPAPRWGGSE